MKTLDKILTGTLVVAASATFYMTGCVEYSRPPEYYPPPPRIIRPLPPPPVYIPVPPPPVYVPPQPIIRDNLERKIQQPKHEVKPSKPQYNPRDDKKPNYVVPKKDQKPQPKSQKSGKPKLKDTDDWKILRPKKDERKP